MILAPWKCVSRLATAVGLILVALQPLAAQNSRSSVEAGRDLASQWCSGCHAVESKTVGIFAADFAEIAKLPSTTALSLKVFFQTSHRSMPNFILQPNEANDIVAYILSLKRK
jgi:mono/diheme cytochrome c family protein